MRIRPIKVWLAGTFGSDASTLTALRLQIKVASIKGNCVVFDVEGAEPVDRPPAGSRKRAADADVGEAEEEPDAPRYSGVGDMVDEWADLCRDSDGWPSVCSSDESVLSAPSANDGAVEPQDFADAEQSSSNDGDEMPQRAARGTYVLRDLSNPYFTFMNNEHHHDLKVRVVSRWCTTGDLGTSDMSKALPPVRFGATKEHPGACLLSLRAWMIWKSKHNGFCNGRSCRRRLFRQAVDDLRRDIHDCDPAGLMTTGNEAADILISQWAPEALVGPA